MSELDKSRLIDAEWQKLDYEIQKKDIQQILKYMQITEQALL